MGCGIDQLFGIKKLDYLHGCQGIENSIHPDEWNADAADYADSHGFKISEPKANLIR